MASCRGEVLLSQCFVSEPPENRSVVKWGKHMAKSASTTDMTTPRTPRMFRSASFRLSSSGNQHTSAYAHLSPKPVASLHIIVKLRGFQCLKEISGDGWILDEYWPIGPLSPPFQHDSELNRLLSFLLLLLLQHLQLLLQLSQPRQLNHGSRMIWD